jgi:hypothetical protein
MRVYEDLITYGKVTTELTEGAMQRLHPILLNPFLLLCKEFLDINKFKIQVNSAKRFDGKRSFHSLDLALAIDCQTVHLDKAESQGLLEKYGLHRPLLSYKPLIETWHLELYPGKFYGERNTNNILYRIDLLTNLRK